MLALELLHRRAGIMRPQSETTRSAVTPAVTRPQCVNMLRGGGVKRFRGHCFAQARCAMGVREILRNTRRPELGASLPWGVSVNGIWCVGDPGRAVTIGGHRIWSRPRYPRPHLIKQWIPAWILAFIVRTDLYDAAFFT